MNCVRLFCMCGLLACLIVGASPSRADVFSQCPPDVDGIDTDGDGIVDNDNVCFHFTGGDGFVNMADGTLLYTFGFDDVTGVPDADVMLTGRLAADLPGPTIVVREGQRLYISLTNVGMQMRPDLFDPHTVHFHGFPEAASIFDGVPEPSLGINMGSTFTYFYNLVEPGTYAYHCHVEATEHMQMGMVANIYVLPIQDMLPDLTDLNGFTHHTGYQYAYNDGDGSTYYDVEYPMQLNSMDGVFHERHIAVQPLPFATMKDTYAMFNGRGYPDTINPNVLWNTAGDLGLQSHPSQAVSSLISATQGQKILLRVVSMSVTTSFTVSALGIPMKVIGRGARILRGPDPDGPGPLLGKNLYYDTSSITVAGGEAWDVILDTTNVAPGTYFFYTTNLNYLSNDAEDFGGMMTEIVVSPPPPPAQTLPGDINVDGSVDSSDVTLFVGVLLGSSAAPDAMTASDMNADGLNDGLDIQLFVDAMTMP